jgi:hypothetical protein
MSENRWLANFTGSRWSLQQGAAARVVSSSWTSSDTNCVLVSTAADGRFGELRTTSAGRALEFDGINVPSMLFNVDCRGETRIYELSLVDGRLTDANTDVGLDGGTRSYRFGAGDLRGDDDTPVSTGEADVTLTVRRGS